ncbi:MAG TPA: hypothetical protein VIV60_35925, partial [Polyangiaceae bacterium]
WSRLDAVSHGPRTSLIDAEWGTPECLQPVVQPGAIAGESLTNSSESTSPSNEPLTSGVASLRATPDSQGALHDESVSVAPQRKARGRLWLAPSIVILGALGLGVVGWLTNDVPTAPASAPVFMSNPSAVTGARTALAVATPGTSTPGTSTSGTSTSGTSTSGSSTSGTSTSGTIPLPIETASKPPVLAAKTGIKLNRRVAVPRKQQPAARTRPKLPSVAAFDDL